MTTSRAHLIGAAVPAPSTGRLLPECSPGKALRNHDCGGAGEDVSAHSKRSVGARIPVALAWHKTSKAVRGASHTKCSASFVQSRVVLPSQMAAGITPYDQPAGPLANG